MAANNNLKLLPELSETIRNSYNRDFISSFIESYKSYPSILVWYTVDEPSISSAKFEDVNDAYNLIKGLDPNHPVFLLDYGQENLEKYGKATNILGTDPYPIPGFPLKRVADFTNMANQAVAYKKPVWIAIQAHNLANYGSPNGRFPTPREEKIMVYLALTHGAKGILYYSFGDVINNEPLWNYLRDLNSEINELSPILLSGDIEQVVQVSPPPQNNEGIHTLLKKYQNKWYLLAVNSENKNIDASFNIPPDWPQGLVRVYKENRTIPVVNRQFTESFGAYDTHVYEINSLHGDANIDGRVDSEDFALLVTDYLKEPVHNTDFNSDGRVDSEDFAILQANYLKQ